MKYVAEYRDAELVRGVIDEIASTVTRDWTLMEISGASWSPFGKQKPKMRCIELDLSWNFVVTGAKTTS